VAPRGEEIGAVARGVDDQVAAVHKPEGVRVDVRGSVQAMRQSFASFAFGLVLAVVLVYLILVAQFQSFLDPFLIMLAVPPGLAGVVLILAATGTTLNVMSLMGVVMLVGIVISNSILIVEFAHRMIEDGMKVREAVAYAARVRLRPVLMTSLATIIGLIPMAAKLGTGSETYAPLARAIIGGLTVSVALTVLVVPSALLLVYRRRESAADAAAGGPAPDAPPVQA
jgi:multidrug efflux pump subunit AcrB